MMNSRLVLLLLLYLMPACVVCVGYRMSAAYHKLAPTDFGELLTFAGQSNNVKRNDTWAALLQLPFVSVPQLRWKISVSASGGPAARAGHSGTTLGGDCVAGDELWVVGGFDQAGKPLNDSWAVGLCSNERRWVRHEMGNASCFSARGGHVAFGWTGFAMPDLSLLVSGGAASVSGEPLQDTWLLTQERGSTAVSCQQFQPPVAPAARHSASSTQSVSGAFMFGGQGGHGQLFNDLWRFDTTNMTWQLLQQYGTAAPEARKEAVLVQLAVPHEALLLHGGLCAEGAGDRPQQRQNICGDAWLYNIQEAVWQRLTNAPAARWGHVGVADAYGQFAFIGGGRNATCTTVEDWWLFNASSHEWEALDTTHIKSQYHLSIV